jgi:6-phosphogluconate dehydrogenase
MNAQGFPLGLIGLGTMGSALAERLLEQGFALLPCSYDEQERARFTARTGFTGVVGNAHALTSELSAPRVVLLMITAGDAVDQVIADLQPHLAPGDVIIDGGNAHFRDTERRANTLREWGVGFVGAGISGGEDGARHGAALMIGASTAEFARCQPVFEALAARAGGRACVSHVGPAPAGHFVKTVHNGIEYALMQVIADLWRTLADTLALDRGAQRDLFARWADGPCAGFLVSLTRDILGVTDDLGPGYLLDQVSDRAGQKGTGRWTLEAALELGVPMPLLGAALHERMISGAWSRRSGRFGFGAPSHQVIGAPTRAPTENWHRLPEVQLSDAIRVEGVLETALLGAAAISFAQGFELIAAARTAWGWRVDAADLARTWQGGCIIRAQLLGRFEHALARQTDAAQLVGSVLGMQDTEARAALRTVVTGSLATGVSVPALSAAVAWLDSLATPRLGTQLIQAQRDAFGAHGFERRDRDGVFHHAWRPDLNA